MKPIGLFATPVDEQTLHTYIQTFCTDHERGVAQLGHDNYKALIKADQMWFEEWCSIHKIESQERIIAMTLAGMTWNWECSQQTKQEQRSKYRDIWIHGTELLNNVFNVK